VAKPTWPIISSPVRVSVITPASKPSMADLPFIRFTHCSCSAWVEAAAATSYQQSWLA
jgi:hypothetical protein